MASWVYENWVSEQRAMMHSATCGTDPSVEGGHKKRILILAVRTLILAVWILVLSSASASANHYGAIAYDRASGSWGASWDQPSQQAANTSALRECEKHTSGCAVVVEFLHFCGAYATGPGTTAGWGTDATRAAAEQRAVNACNSRGGPCEAKVWACNTTPPEPARDLQRCQSLRLLFGRDHPGARWCSGS